MGKQADTRKNPAARVELIELARRCAQLADSAEDAGRWRDAARLHAVGAWLTDVAYDRSGVPQKLPGLG